MKTALWLCVLSLVAFAPLAAIAEEAPKDIRELAKGLVAEDPDIARRAEEALVALGWPVVHELELLKSAKFLTPQDQVAFEPRAEQVQRRVEAETWSRTREVAQAALDQEAVEKKSLSWTLNRENYGGPKLRRFLRDHVVFVATENDCVMPPTMAKVAVRVSTGKILKFDDDPTPLFNEEGLKPETPEQAMEAAELFDLLTLDEQFDLRYGLVDGLKAGGCVLLQKADDVPGADKAPVEAAARVAPPSTRAGEGGFEVVRCLWYELGGRLVRRTLTFRAGGLETKTEELATRVGAYSMKK